LGLSLNTWKNLSMLDFKYGMKMKKKVCNELLESTNTKFFYLDPKPQDCAHQYVLTNVACLAP
jgi:hypothetical protein